jgi:hypothetical protein
VRSYPVSVAGPSDTLRLRPVPVATAFAISIAAHVAVVVYAYALSVTPQLPFEFEMPSEVEFGVTEAVAVDEPAVASPARAEPEPAPEPEPEPEDPEGEARAAAPDAGPPRRPDAGPRRRPRDAGVPDAGPPALAAAPGPVGATILPPGQQIALRLDVATIHASAVGGEVARLLAVLPDWVSLLDGSGIDPLVDLDRILITTPNLQRSRIIAAGRATGGAAAIRAAAETLAASRGLEARWREEEGVELADWHDGDRVARIVALIGPRHFVVCRPVDLPRVLAVARSRQGEGEEPADALLAMRPGEGVSLEIEGARGYAVNSPRRQSPVEMVPTRLRLGVREEAGRYGIHTRWRYDDPAQAEAARTFWDGQRLRAANNVALAFMGVGRVLDRTELAQDGRVLEGTVTLSEMELRRFLRLARSMVGRPPPRALEAVPEAEGPVTEAPPENPF